MAAPKLTPTAIRQDLVARLADGISTVAGRVFDSRMVRVEEDELPALGVGSTGASGDRWGLAGGSLQQHRERITVHGMVKAEALEGGALEGEAEVAAALDSLLEAVEDLLATNEEWTSTCHPEKFDATKKVEAAGDAGIVGEFALSFEVAYQIQREIVPATDEDLTGVDVTTAAERPDGAGASERDLLAPVDDKPEPEEEP